jgi:hypothetical protein
LFNSLCATEREAIAPPAAGIFSSTSGGNRNSARLGFIGLEVLSQYPDAPSPSKFLGAAKIHRQTSAPPESGKPMC